MKRILLTWLATVIALNVVPLAVIGLPGAPEEKPDGAIYDEKNDLISVEDSETGEVVSMPFRDYIIGAAAGEMPAAYEYEALCAQALCSRTLALYLAGYYADGGETAISTDPAKHQAYMSVEEMKEKWGDSFETYYKKLCKAVDEVSGYLVTYDGKAALTVFHAISPGVTERAENVWHGELPYLRGVESAWDKEAPGSSSSYTVGEEELCEKLGVTKRDGEELFGEFSRSEAGTVLSVQIGGKSFTGLEIRRALGLRSAVFTVSDSEKEYTFTVSGYGHGVGMSQYGANCLAKEGKTWREIIAYYYPGTQISAR